MPSLRTCYRHPIRSCWLRLSAMLLGWVVPLNSVAWSQEPVDFESDVAPLFAASCLKCHGPDEPAGELDLTDPTSVEELGILEGETALETTLISRLTESDPDLRMPPDAPPVDAQSIHRLVRWIDEGAEWPIHWSYQPLARPIVPAVVTSDKPFTSESPIDAFIDSRLARTGLKQSPEAERRLLIRRLSIDLLGLAPTPDDVRRFLADDRPDAWNRLVDRLLASPHYGERWARRWMDLVHFAETHGHDQDRPRDHAWPYRDYLIRSFNNDKPYARFVSEQIAGDQYYPHSPDSLEGLGMLAAGPWDESSLRDIREDSIDREKGRYLDRDDIVTTVMSTFASTSAHCARCHDHKFDPVSQESYYGLQAIFAATDKANRTYDSDPAMARRRAEIQSQLTTIRQQHEAGDESLVTPHNLELVARWEAAQQDRVVVWRELIDPQAQASAGTQLSLKDDGSWLAEGPTPDKEIYTVTGQVDLDSMTAIRLELLPDELLPVKGPGRAGNGNLHINEIRLFQMDGQGRWLPLAIRGSASDFDQEGWTLAMALDGNPNTAWGIYPEVGKRHVAILQLDQSIEMTSEHALRVELHQIHGGSHLVGRFRLTATDAARPLQDTSVSWTDDLRRVLAKSAADRTRTEQLTLIAHVLRSELVNQQNELPPLGMIYCGTNRFEADGTFRPALEPRLVHVLNRGQVEQPESIAEPRVPEMLDAAGLSWPEHPLDTDLGRRAALADWLVDPSNSLSWRSIANRLWQAQFGQALVSTPNDFGHMGARPTHPELLEYLATDLQRYEGSMKRLQRNLLCSSSYRQSSALTSEGQQADGNNRYLWRMNRRRLDAETFRDSLLVASRQLDTRMGGPSVRAFVQSPGIHVTPVVDYEAFDLDDPANRRRSVYRFVFRTIPDPLMEALDCPDSSQLAPKRNESVTVLQALATWNDRFVLHQCEQLGRELEQQTESPEERCSQLYQRLFQREPTPEEEQAILDYAQRFGWANTARVLVNSNEFMFLD